jgi:hypothetical protein
MRHSPTPPALRDFRAGDETEAQERAWVVVRAAYAERAPAPRRRRHAGLALVAATGALLCAVALSPAGAAVHHWLQRVLGVPHARAALFSLPAPGRLLLSSAGGTWAVTAHGERRRVGAESDAAFSPHARYVILARGDELTAVDPRGQPQWSIARVRVRRPAWFAPSGFRVAYLSGSAVRVIAGDGTGDHRLATGAASVQPAWQPSHQYALAYAEAPGIVVLRDADTGTLIWQRRLPARVRRLGWNAAGTRLLALTRGSAYVLDARGRVQARVGAGAGGLRDGALSPDGRRLALLDAHGVTVSDVRPGRLAAQRAFTGARLGQVEWSPDGHWLLVTWPAAGQWVFVHLAGRPRIIAVSGIAREFGPGRSFPTVAGWCCTAGGSAG